MAGGGVSLPGAQAYALPSYIWVGPLACSWWSLLGSAGLLGCWWDGDGSSALGPLPW